jgi:hypothetical protein
MNSSVTTDRAISVTSSWCLADQLQQQIEGPSKLVRWTVKGAGSATRSAVATAVDGAVATACASVLTDGKARRRVRRSGSAAQAADQHRVAAILREVGQQHRHRLADDPAAVGRQAVLGAQ